MKNFLLSAALIALPVSVFTVVELGMPKTSAAIPAVQPGLGDLSRYLVIVKDVEMLAASGDFKAAGRRATDFETLWDQEEPALRQTDKSAWGVIDGAADDSFSALRRDQPKAEDVDKALRALQAALESGGTESGGGGPQVQVGGIAVSDQAGHPIPCEEMLRQLRAASSKGAGANADKIAEFEAKGTERCNADDDRNADSFFAQGIALAGGN